LWKLLFCRLPSCKTVLQTVSAGKRFASVLCFWRFTKVQFMTVDSIAAEFFLLLQKQTEIVNCLEKQDTFIAIWEYLHIFQILSENSIAFQR